MNDIFLIDKSWKYVIKIKIQEIKVEMDTTEIEARELLDSKIFIYLEKITCVSDIDEL